MKQRPKRRSRGKDKRHREDVARMLRDNPGLGDDQAFWNAILLKYGLGPMDTAWQRSRRTKKEPEQCT